MDGSDALAAGGTEAREPMDHGYMYARSFYDLDGHHGELLWMDPQTIENRWARSQEEPGHREEGRCRD